MGFQEKNSGCIFSLKSELIDINYVVIDLYKQVYVSLCPKIYHIGGKHLIRTVVVLKFGRF